MSGWVFQEIILLWNHTGMKMYHYIHYQKIMTMIYQYSCVIFLIHWAIQFNVSKNIFVLNEMHEWKDLFFTRRQCVIITDHQYTNEYFDFCDGNGVIKPVALWSILLHWNRFNENEQANKSFRVSKYAEPGELVNSQWS